MWNDKILATLIFSCTEKSDMHMGDSCDKQRTRPIKPGVCKNQRIPENTREYHRIPENFSTL